MRKIRQIDIAKPERGRGVLIGYQIVLIEFKTDVAESNFVDQTARKNVRFRNRKHLVGRIAVVRRIGAAAAFDGNSARETVAGDVIVWNVFI